MPPWFSDFEDFPEDSFRSDDQDEGASSLLEHPEHGKQQSDGELSASKPQNPTPSASRSTSAALSNLGSVESLPNDGAHAAPQQHPKQRFEVQLPNSTLVTPRGRYAGWTPPALRATESLALASLISSLESQAKDDSEFIAFDLDKFSVYVDSVLYSCELRPLHHLSTKGPDEFYFDGVLEFGDMKFYVERVPFSELPIGNYGTSHASIGDQLWIRSRANANAKREVYYKLRNPAAEYKRFHTPFLWIADLAKHVVDFCGHNVERGKAVTLRHFQHAFLKWLQNTHKKSLSFRRWHQAHGSDDFRTAVTANIEFVWKEVYGLLGSRVAHSLQLFKEVKHLTQYRPFTAALGDKRNPVQPSTIVTPYIHKCFGHSEFGALLEPLRPREDEDKGTPENGPDFKTAQELERAEAPDLPRIGRPSTKRDSAASAAHRHLVDNIKPGHTISTPPDDAGTGTKWKQEVARGSTYEHRWFGLVQQVHVSPKTRARSFDVNWLYRPVDTPCCKMVYPWSKELFLSDHCTCEEGRDARVDDDEVLKVHDVDWFGSPETSTAEFFVRQTYQVEQRRWVTLEKGHMACAHNKPESVGYKRGDTVLAATSTRADRADVYEVVKLFKQGDNKFARLRRLIRREELEQHLRGVDPRPNELVYTEQTVVTKRKRILGKCIVRIFAPGDRIPCPYDRNGTGNVFFITHRLEKGGLMPVADYNRPTTMRQGFDPKRRVEKLRGLDLFCGSGNFGRGLEEGGVVDMCWSNDIWTEAIHSYMVNASHHTKPFLGSVDDLLRRAIEGGQGLPRRGEVDLISGGSPCQGFSLITSDKTNDRQKKNRSLVASFASFVDFYRPKYGILENVLNIVQTGRNRDEDVFSQLICAIVGMGYQTQLILGDAWTYGAPQSRSRAFLYFAAPGQRLPEPPRPSHSHFEGVKSRGLGAMTNGESFVRRSFGPTPFKFVSTAEATADIPEIYDAKPDYCVGFPDHRISMGVTNMSRQQYNRIPTQPYGMDFVKTWNDGEGVMTAAERDLFPHTGLRVQKMSKGWGRVKPNSVFHTITTTVTPTDARTGRFLHWYENRPITILEARRAQGFLDHEVLVGTPSAQYELVGNSVARPIALALGLQFREAWLGSLYDDRVPVSSVDAELTKLFMDDCEAQAVEVDLDENDWTDDGDDSLSVGNTPDPEEYMRNGMGYLDTPPTSVSGSEAKDLLSTASRKRPLSQSLIVELHASKIRRRDADGMGVQSGVNGALADTVPNDSSAVDFPPADGMESEQSNLVYDAGELDLSAENSLAGPMTDGNLAVRSLVDLTVARSAESSAGLGTTAVQSSTSLVIDLTED